MSKFEEIGAFEAKTRLSELLRETERGASYVIRRRGKAVARLVPPAPPTRVEDLARVRASFAEIRSRRPGTVSVLELIEEGRRF
jgi:prevent-host-death family protein